MLEISKMIKSLTDTESELKRIIQVVQVHERGINIEYKVKIKDKDTVELYLTFDKNIENDKYISGIISLINETMVFCEECADNYNITKIYSKYLF